MPAAGTAQHSAGLVFTTGPFLNRYPLGQFTLQRFLRKNLEVDSSQTGMEVPAYVGLCAVTS